MIPLILAVAQEVMQAGGMGAQDTANRISEARTLAMGKYNAKLDNLDADQLEKDTDVNLALMRQKNKVYLSRQRAGYAANGILNTGSPLAVQAETAGRLEMGVKQEYINSRRKIDMLHSEADAGLRSSAATAQAYNIQNQAQRLNGGAALISSGYQAYQSGMFSGGGGGGSTSYSDMVDAMSAATK